jgi:hypothetical protein
MKPNDTPPGPTVSASDRQAFRYQGGPLGPDTQRTMIGGTHNVSSKLDPETCLTGGYQPIAGDDMPAGAPTDGNAPYTGPYLPKN